MTGARNQASHGFRYFYAGTDNVAKISLLLWLLIVFYVCLHSYHVYDTLE